ncbi:DUF402 domain-containing protein [Thermoactinospora rubra]|uniref:DUF402 domain-containing protein n=1 Tax=Thermoactinospora rubra TaxID=1088767 RepID=UPI000A0F64EE|nr:DUF402 domain-containing protein [Thermoactinospora rubra]
MKVVFRKYDGSLHWHHPGRLLGEDAHGVWVGCEAGTSGQRGHEPPVVWERAFVMLFPRDRWWVALFNEMPHSCEVYVDVTTVPVWADGEVTMVDLDLDVIRRPGGEVVLDDADEFADHRVKFGYPPEVVAQAEASAEWLLAAVAEHRGPFGGAHEPWLAQVRSPA